MHLKDKLGIAWYSIICGSAGCIYVPVQHAKMSEPRDIPSAWSRLTGPLAELHQNLRRCKCRHIIVEHKMKHKYHNL